MAQLVCRYRKGEEVRWISHLDVKRTLERAMRRAKLPLSLTQGHNPRPKLSLGPPLSLGFTGEAELLAIHLDEAIDPNDVRERLNSHLPRGLEVTEVWVVPGYRKKETFGDIDVAEYRVVIQGDANRNEIESRVRELMARAQLPVRRGGERPDRTVDLRPLILGLEVAESERDEVALMMRLQTGSHGGARAQEIVALLNPEETEWLVRYERTGLHAGQKTTAVSPTGGRRRRWSQARVERERS